jgi:hypothetical protein
LQEVARALIELVRFRTALKEWLASSVGALLVPRMCPTGRGCEVIREASR